MSTPFERALKSTCHVNDTNWNIFVAICEQLTVAKFSKSKDADGMSQIFRLEGIMVKCDETLHDHIWKTTLTINDELVASYASTVLNDKVVEGFTFMHLNNLHLTMKTLQKALRYK